MKKIISTVLLLAMVLSLLAGCTLVPADYTEGLDNAKKYLISYFQDSSTTTDADWTVIGKIPVDGVDYTVTWTSDNENVKIVPQDNGLVLIDVPELTAEEVTYTLTATITAPSGATVEYSITRKISASASVGKTDEDIVREAYALAEGAEMEGTATLTGVVKSIRIPYDAGFQNITVVIQVGTLADMPIDCYRLSSKGGQDVSNLAPGDTVTIQGTLMNKDDEKENSNGTVQFAAGAIATKIVKSTNNTCPSTTAEILAAAKALGEGWSLPYKATLTGVVTSVGTGNDAWNPSYQNLTCNIEVDGNEIICYRMLDKTSTMGPVLKVGDTITVTGYLMNYKGDLEFGQGCNLDALVPGEGGGETPEPPKAQLPEISAPVVGTPYKFGIVQVTNGKTVWVTGAVSGRYLATTTDKAAAIDVYLEEADGGYKFYILVDGAKNYIYIYNNAENKRSVAYSATEASVFTYKADISTWATTFDGTACYVGSYNNFDTLSVSDLSYINTNNAGISQFPAGFWPSDATGDDNTDEPENPGTGTETPDDGDDTTTEPETLTILEAIAKGKTFAHDTYTTEKYYIVGTIKAITNTKYGNMTLVDEAGNTLTIYGSYSADGKTGYGDMTEKPGAGDTVKLLGIIGQFSNAPQMKNGWIIEYTAHTCEFTTVTCEDDSVCKFCGVVNTPAPGHLDENKDHICERECGETVGLHIDKDGNSVCDYGCTEKIEAGGAPVVGTLATFDFGANGSATHVDGSGLGEAYTYEADGYKLSLTGLSKVYGSAFDAKGNSCIKLGTGDTVATMTFEVPEEVTEVVIYVAKYKAKNTKITINGGTQQTISTSSDNGEYTEIKVDTTTTKTITLATVSSNTRCMINTIVFNGYVK